MKQTKYGPYSSSRLATFAQCPRRFQYQYINKLPAPWTESFATDRGKLLHMMLEHSTKDGTDFQKIKQEKEFKEIVKRELLKKDDIKDTIKVYENFRTSKVGQGILSKERVFSELAIGLDYDMNITPFNPRFNKEKMDKLYFRGFLDYGFVKPAKTKDEEDVLVICDWKSGKYKSQQEQKWDQLLWYSLSMFSEMPYDNIMLMFVYVDHNKVNAKLLQRKNLQKYKDALHRTIDKIENASVFEKKESGLCDWCPFQEHCLSDFDIREEDMPF